MSTVIEKAKNIRCFVTDVDGVLTDGRLYFNAEGDAMKAFSAQDGLGMHLLMDTGVDIAFITGRGGEHGMPIFWS